ncbi:MAG: hypothetical protein QM639_19985, partial [Rhodocyclaceae bacterium]
MSGLSHADRLISPRGAATCALVVAAHLGVGWGLHAYGGPARTAPTVMPVHLMNARIELAATPP